MQDLEQEIFSPMKFLIKSLIGNVKTGAQKKDRKSFQPGYRLAGMKS